MQIFVFSCKVLTPLRTFLRTSACSCPDSHLQSPNTRTDQAGYIQLSLHKRPTAEIDQSQNLIPKGIKTLTPQPHSEPPHHQDSDTIPPNLPHSQTQLMSFVHVVCKPPRNSSSLDLSGPSFWSQFHQTSPLHEVLHLIGLDCEAHPTHHQGLPQDLSEPALPLAVHGKE